MCLISGCLTNQSGITRHSMAKTTETLVEANIGRIEPDDAVFLDLTLGNALSR